MHVDEAAVLIRLKDAPEGSYREGMNDKALYEATRGTWVVSPRREKAEYALAVVGGVVREVYRIRAWHPANTIPYRTRADLTGDGRWEFEGAVADDAVRRKYVGQSVHEYFPRHAQNPIRYVNC